MEQSDYYIVADAGATKTKWQVRPLAVNHQVGCLRFDGPAVFEMRSPGINPNQQSEEELGAIIRPVLAQIVDRNFAPFLQLAYFGAGLGNISNRLLLKRLFEESWPKGKTKLGSAAFMTDLHAVGWGAMSQYTDTNTTDMAIGILGTGSNVGIYSPTAGFGQVTMTRPSLGCWLGDFGSGADIGKRILTSWVRDELDEDIKTILEDLHGSAGNYLKDCYHSQQPAAKLGQLVRDLELVRGHEQLVKLRAASFTVFAEQEVKPLLQAHGFKAVRLSGGIASSFHDELGVILANQLGIYIKTVAEPF